MRRQSPLLVLLTLGFGAPAMASEPAVDLSIPVQARQDALLALARQAGLSLGFAPGAHCEGQAGVVGRLGVNAALGRLLDGSNCDAVRPDSRTVVIRARMRRGQGRGPPPATPLPPEPSRPQISDVREIVVTAEKRETLLAASASSLTAVSGQDLARRGVDDLGGLGLLAAGVMVTNLGPGRDKVLLRGLSDGPLTGHTQATVAVYLGELRLAYNTPDPDLPLIDVARLEVLRGPQGSLYGGGSIGGVLHVVPNAPDPSERSGSIEAQAAATRFGSGSYKLRLVANAPLLHGAAAARIVAWNDVSGGYVDNPLRGLKNIDRTRQRGFRLSGLAHPAAEVRLEGALIVQMISTWDAHYVQPSVGPLARASVSAEPHDNDFLALSLSAHWAQDWGELTAMVAGTDHDVVTTYDASLAAPSLIAPKLGALLIGAVDFRDETRSRALVSEVRLTSNGAGRWQWLAGGFTTYGQQQLDTALSAVGGSGYREQRRDRLFEGAVFGEASYDLTRNLTISAGGRVFDTILKTRSQVSLASPLRDFDGRARDGGLSRKLRIAYRFSPRFSVYGLAAEGYRTAGFNTGGPPGQAFATQPDTFQPLRRYRGDELWSYEVGANWRAQDGHVAIRATGFLGNWQDIQTNLVSPSGLPFTANLGDGRSRGVELEASYNRGAFRLTGNAVLEESELTRPDLSLSAFEADTLPGIPAISFSVLADYEMRLSRTWSLALDAGYAYVGRSQLALDTTSSARMGGYGGLRLSATARGQNMRLGLVLDNALDSRGDTLAFGNPFSFRAGAQQTPQRPRTVSLRLSRSY